jgi:hypothetical protein
LNRITRTVGDVLAAFHELADQRLIFLAISVPTFSLSWRMKPAEEFASSPDVFWYLKSEGKE